ncbi:alpha-N-acetylgalactosaminidase isoform X1 [Phoca vitulina]|uniref:alpha-N-acetylgalactosaminidase isoform X1 n=1 Tax=Phoca vitulina TaxID=9720 RepID=UPI001395E75E|nr:alpha-N-acetylgalactosaminidase isoform X1 [Phoca vitulina]XP_032272708.1 alpha-N-acetylgalactosaminidase isoform X1 [Phoca vitulina]XP_035954187.1 alpha-N-acetylgalactosaminidase isoform X2 [Halichoerus grypus]
MLLKTVVLLALVAQVLMLENGLLRKPPMGWLAWERFRCNTNCDEDPKNCISERLFMDMADRLAQDGWRDLGYTYLNIDDCWIGGRDAKGRLVPDPKRFPNGIAFLADYAHSLGLKLGIYGDMGNFTCMRYPGTTLDKVIQDAQTFAEWKVDMLKLDGCFSTPEERAKGYPKMAAALNATGRPIAFSCSWPAYEGGLPPKVNYTLLAEICNLWRNYDDIQDSWSSVLSILNWFVDNQDILQPVAGPGHWNDPDMLLIGNFGLSFEQARAQMALWTVLAAPLFMSTDLRTISAQNMDILQNPLMIKINQDPLGIQGRRILKVLGCGEREGEAQGLGSPENKAASLEVTEGWASEICSALTSWLHSVKDSTGSCSSHSPLCQSRTAHGIWGRDASPHKYTRDSGAPRVGSTRLLHTSVMSGRELGLPS